MVTKLQGGRKLAYKYQKLGKLYYQYAEIIKFQAWISPSIVQSKCFDNLDDKRLYRK